MGTRAYVGSVAQTGVMSILIRFRLADVDSVTTTSFLTNVARHSVHYSLAPILWVVLAAFLVAVAIGFYMRGRDRRPT
jgi:hypothetical protein